MIHFLFGSAKNISGAKLALKVSGRVNITQMATEFSPSFLSIGKHTSTMVHDVPASYVIVSFFATCFLKHMPIQSNWEALKTTVSFKGKIGPKIPVLQALPIVDSF